MRTTATRRPINLAAAVALAILFGGFIPLSLMWWLGEWPTNVPGLFSYRSATVGDALLLPFLAGLLTAGACSLPRTPNRQSEWGLSLLASCLGIVGAAATQFFWIRDPDPRLNWTLPAPGTFNSAGWYHAGFFVVATGLLLGLYCLLLVRLRRCAQVDRASVARIIESPWAALAVASALAFVALVSLDNASAAGTAAGMSTTAAVIVSSVVVAATLAFSLRSLILRAIRTFLLGGWMAAGIVLASAHAPVLTHGWLGYAFTVSIALSIALVSPTWHEQLRTSLLRGLGTFLLLLGTSNLAVSIFDSWQAGLAVSGAAISSSTWLLSRSRMEFSISHTVPDSLLAVVGTVSALGTLTLAGWLLEHEGVSRDDANYLFGLALGLGLGSIIWLVKRRFRELISLEEAVAEADRSGNVRNRDRAELLLDVGGPSIWGQLAGWSIAIFVSLGVLLVALAAPLHLDPAGADRPSHITAMFAVMALPFLIAMIGYGRSLQASHSPSTKRTSSAQKLRLLPDPVAVVCFAIATISWIVGHLAILLLGSQGPFPTEFLIAAMFYGVMTGESVVVNTASLQGTKAGGAVWTIAGLTGWGAAIALYSLLNVGLWLSDVPVQMSAAVPLILTVLLGTAGIATFAIGILAGGTRTRRLTINHPVQNGLQDQLLYAGFMLLSTVTPVMGIARGFDGFDLGVWATLIGLAGLFGAGLWTLKNNQYHAREAASKISPKGVEGRIGSNESARLALIKRHEWNLRLHIIFQNGLPIVFFFAAAAWLVIQVT